MTTLRQPKLRPALRICAVLSLLVWVSAVSYCSLEFLFNHVESGHHAAQAEHHHDDVARSQQESGHSHDSDGNGKDENACCSSLKAIPLTAGSSLVVSKPDFGKLASLDFLWLVKTLTLSLPETAAPRQPPERDWVFTPEVCLGPAHRSHAPPLSA